MIERRPFWWHFIYAFVHLYVATRNCKGVWNHELIFCYEV